jgi:glycosyltransferase involved in cell wall biosynthesis
MGSTPPTNGMLGGILRKIKKVPFVYNLQDVFPDSLVNTGLSSKNSILWKIGRKIENFSYRNADKIIVISEDFKRNIMEKGVPENKIDVIYNWVDENAVSPIIRNENPIFDKYSLDREKFYITYCGNIGLTQNMDMLIEVAKELDLYENICFVLVGDGSYKSEIEKNMKKTKLKNMILLPFQPYEQISNVFSLGDVGLIISKANIGQNSVPSKTWSIMSAQRPVLASFDLNSELNKVIERADCGICVPPDDKKALKDAILFLYNNKEHRITKGENGRKYILENLTRAVGTAKYIKAFDDL